jgi:hypothetical protein
MRVFWAFGGVRVTEPNAVVPMVHEEWSISMAKQGVQLHFPHQTTLSGEAPQLDLRRLCPADDNCPRPSSPFGGPDARSRQWGRHRKPNGLSRCSADLETGRECG